MIELKPCKSCGNYPELNAVFNSEDNDGWWATIECPYCEIVIDVDPCSSLETAIDGVIYGWNWWYGDREADGDA